jgi:hyperpolarization activated cyclic nucleotide-gated potassium channel 2
MWDLLCMLLIFYEILGIPFKISFDLEISNEFDLFVDVVFACDIFLNFNTAYYENGT